MENWFEKEYFDSKIIIFTVPYEIGVSYLMMTTEICLGPVSLLLTNSDRQIFNRQYRMCCKQIRKQKFSNSEALSNFQNIKENKK